MPIGETELILIILVDTIGCLFLGAFVGRTLTRFPFGVTGFTGVESMIGRKCIVTSVSDSRIEVTADSQVWAARLVEKQDVKTGDKGVVKGVDGLTLLIQKIKP